MAGGACPAVSGHCPALPSPVASGRCPALPSHALLCLANALPRPTLLSPSPAEVHQILALSRSASW